MFPKASRRSWVVGLIAAVVLTSFLVLVLGPFAPVPRSSLSPPTGPAAPTNPPNTSNPSGPSGPGVTSSPTSVTVLAGWEGIRYGSNHGVLDYVDPPDVPLAVGPTYVFELTNGMGTLWTKSGTFVQTVNPQGLFQVSSTDGIGDARVIYDGLSGRWFASAADFTTGNVLLAVSTSGDPTGPWRAYAYATGQGCPDQPWIGLDSDTVVLSLNTFSTCDGTFTGGMFWAINKTDLVSGAAPRSTTWGPNLNYLNMVPVQAATATSTAYLVRPIQPNYVRVFTLTGAPPASVSLSYADYPVSSLTSAPNAVQPGTNYTLRTGDNRLRDGVWSAGKLWIAYNDGCVPSGDTVTRACVRLTQLDTTNQTVLQDFDVGLANAYAFYPALRTDGNGNLVVVFGVSSTTVYPGVAVAMQSPTNPRNVLGPWTTVRAGTGSRSPGTGSCGAGVCRYGDYFGVAVDPSNTSRVWTAGEYGNTTGWGTYINEVSAPSSSSPPPAIPPSVSTNSATSIGSSGATLQGSLTGLGSATAVAVGFQFGANANLNGATNVTVGTETATGGFSQAVSGFAASTTYYFRAWANGQGFATGSILSFTTLAAPTSPPSVSTWTATGINATAATLQGSLTGLGTATSVTVGFLYSTSGSLSGAANVTAGTLTATGSFSRGVLSLAASTTYYFAAWGNGQGFTKGLIVSFTTAAPPSAPPSVSTVGATAINTSAATLQGSLTSLGTATSSTVGFLYGTSATLSAATNVTVGTRTATGSFTSAVSGLVSNTTYYFRAWASGTGFATGSILSFVTAAPPPPGVVALTLCFDVVGGGTGFSAPTLSYVQGGVTKSATLTTSANSFTVDTGSTWSVTNPLTGSGPSERWVTNQAVRGTASASTSTVFSYYHQDAVSFAFQVQGGGSGYSAPSVTYTSSGTTVSTATGIVVWADASAAYDFPSSLAGSSSTEAWRTDMASGTVDGSGTISSTYYHEFAVIFTYGIVGGGSGMTAPTATTSQFGSSVSLLTGSAVWVDAGAAYALTNPLQGSTASERWIASAPSGTILSAATVIVPYYHQVLLTFAFSVTGGGSGYSAPTVTYASFGGTSLTTLGIAVWADAGARYQFQSPLPGSSGTQAWQTASGSGNLSRSQTITATYYHQFLVTFLLSTVNGNGPTSTPLISAMAFGASASLAVGSTAWVDANSSFSYPAVIPGATGERWQAGASASGTVTAAGSIAAFYYHQYSLALSYQVVGGGGGYAAPSIQGVQASQPLSVTAGATAWLDAGSWYQYALRLPGSTASERWLTAIPGGTVAASSTVTVTYSHQFLVDFNYSVSGGGSGYAAPNVTYSNLSTRAVSPAGPVWVWADAQAGYQFQSPLPGSTATSSWRTNNGSGTIASATTYSATYRHQYKLKFKTTSLSGSPTPVTPLINATVFGTLVGIPSGTEAWVDAGGTYDFPGVFYGPQPGERWVTDTPANGTVTGPMNLSAGYLHEFFLTIQLNSGDGGSVSLASSWFDAGAPLTLRAQASPGWQFQGWVGTGDGSYTGAAATTPISMNSPVTETAIFYVGITLMAGSGGSIQYSYAGSAGSVPAGAYETLYVPPGTAISLTASPTSFYDFSSWNGGNLGSASSTTIQANAPQSVSAAFGLSLYSKVDSVLGLAVGFALLALVALAAGRRRRRKKEKALQAARLRARARAHTYR